MAQTLPFTEFLDQRAVKMNYADRHDMQRLIPHAYPQLVWQAERDYYESLVQEDSTITLQRALELRQL